MSYDPTLRTGDAPTIEAYLPESDSYLISFRAKFEGSVVRSHRMEYRMPRLAFSHIRDWVRDNHGVDPEANDAHILRRVEQYYDGYEGCGVARWVADYDEGARSFLKFDQPDASLTMSEEQLEAVAYDLNRKYAAGI